MSQKKTITKNMLLAEVVEKFPEMAEVLVEEYGFHCVGCYASTMETLAEGAAVHGMEEKEVERMIADLNLRLEKEAVEKKKNI